MLRFQSALTFLVLAISVVCCGFAQNVSYRANTRMQIDRSVSASEASTAGHSAITSDTISSQIPKNPQSPVLPQVSRNTQPDPDAVKRFEQTQAKAKQIIRHIDLPLPRVDEIQVPSPVVPEVASNDLSIAGGDDDALASTSKTTGKKDGSKLLSNRFKERDTSEGESALKASGSVGYIVQTLISLGLVIGIMFAIKWGYSRATGQVATTNTQVVQVLGRTSIAPRNHVILLRVGSRILICSDSTHGTRTLSEITDPEEVAQILAQTSASKDNSISKGFNQMLGRYGQDYDSKGRLPNEGLDTVEFQTDRARESVTALLSRVRSMKGKGGSS